jgi:hypothetical protein
MAIRTDLPYEKLSQWYFSVQWAAYYVELSINRSVENGWSTHCDSEHLARLNDLKQFLGVALDDWLTQLEADCRHAVPEVCRES